MPQIYRSVETSTGLSLVAGDPVTQVADLPEHAVELHFFRSSDAASAFVDGLEIAGGRNTLAWTWQTGTSAQNAGVILARIDEPRPAGEDLADVIKVVRHDATRHDSASHRQAMDRIHAERREREERDANDRAPLVAALQAAEVRISQQALNWVTTSQALIVKEADGYRLSSDAPRDDVNATLDLAAIAERAGLRLSTDRHEFLAGPFENAGDAAAAVSRFVDANELAEADRKSQHWSVFEASMTMTPSRRRFLTAGAEQGVHVGSHRNSRYARAGGYEIKASELDRMIRIGWLPAGFGRVEVTDKGRQAAGIEDEPAPAFGR